MINLIEGSLQLLDRQRRILKTYITALCFVFLAGILVHALIQFAMNQWLNPINAVFGLVLMMSAILVIWMQGGQPLDVILVVYVTTDGRNKATVLDHALARLLIGFFTVWSFVNIVFVILPFWASMAGFGLVLTATPSYFMFRHMARQSIDWSSWTWFPKVNIIFGGLVCIFCALKPVVTHWLNG